MNHYIITAHTLTDKTSYCFQIKCNAEDVLAYSQQKMRNMQVIVDNCVIVADPIKRKRK